jgi:hypothetical protein
VSSVAGSVKTLFCVFYGVLTCVVFDDPKTRCYAFLILREFNNLQFYALLSSARTKIVIPIVTVTLTHRDWLVWKPCTYEPMCARTENPESDDAWRVSKTKLDKDKNPLNVRKLECMSPSSYRIFPRSSHQILHVLSATLPQSYICLLLYHH